MSFYKMFNILNIEMYTFMGGIRVKGSFEGLYTFLEVAEIYGIDDRSEEHTSELQSRGLISYAVFCLKKRKVAQ